MSIFTYPNNSFVDIFFRDKFEVTPQTVPYLAGKLNAHIIVPGNRKLTKVERIL